jgi:DNA primase catalytic subunit
LEEFFLKLGEGHQKFILEYWQRKVIAKDPAFKDIHKIEMLNRVSNGGLRNVILDLETEKEREKIAAAKK